MRADDRQCFGIEVRHVDRVADCPFKQRGADRLRNFNSDTFLRFSGRSAKVRSQNQIRCGTKRRIFGQRFDLKYVQSRRRNMSILQRTRERRFVDQTATRAIDDAHAGFRF